MHAAPIHKLAANTVIIKQIPAKHRVVKVGNRTYFVSSGVYYERQGRNYVVVQAPLGLRVAALPNGYVIKRVGSRRYYFANGTYYIKRGNEFEVVKVRVS